MNSKLSTVKDPLKNDLAKTSKNPLASKKTIDSSIARKSRIEIEGLMKLDQDSTTQPLVFSSNSLSTGANSTIQLKGVRRNLADRCIAEASQGNPLSFSNVSRIYRLLLEKEPTGEVSRSHLYSFIMDYLSDFLAGKKLQLPSFFDCLKECGSVQMLTIGRDATIEVLTLVKTLDSCLANASCHSLILFQDLLVSTTLSPDDTTNENLIFICCYEVTPRVLSSSTSSWSYLLRGGSISKQSYNSHNTSHGGNVGNRVIRPLQHGKWSKGKDGFLQTDIWGMEASGWVGSTPKF